MSEIILFNPIGDSKRITFTIPPWALLHIAAVLVKDFSVSIIDQNVEPRWKEVLKRELNSGTLFIGVTAMTGMQLNYVKEFLDAAKEIRAVPIIWGGGHASFFPEQTLKSGYADIVVVGEGEATIWELAQAIKNGSSLDSIRGIYYKQDGKIIQNHSRDFIDMDTIPRLPYHLVNMERYIFRTSYAKRNLEICSSRGCPHGCIFCYNTALNHKCWRSMSPHHVVEELQYLVKTFKIDGLNWREDNFFVDKNRIKTICELIIQEKINVKWHADARIDYFDGYENEFIDLLKRSGCKRISFGIESGSNKIIKSVDKGISIEQILRVNQLMKRHKLQCYYHFSFGYIGETATDSLETLRLALRLLEENPYARMWPASLYTPYPGTPMFDDAVKSGFKVPEDLEGFTKFIWSISNLPWLTKDYSKQLTGIVFIMTGFSSNLPIVRTWFKFRMEQTVRNGKPGRIFERKIADSIRSTIRSVKTFAPYIPQISA